MIAAKTKKILLLFVLISKLSFLCAQGVLKHEDSIRVAAMFKRALQPNHTYHEIPPWLRRCLSLPRYRKIVEVKDPETDLASLRSGLISQLFIGCYLSTDKRYGILIELAYPGAARLIFYEKADKRILAIQVKWFSLECPPLELLPQLVSQSGYSWVDSYTCKERQRFSRRLY